MRGIAVVFVVVLLSKQDLGRDQGDLNPGRRWDEEPNRRGSPDS